MTSINWDLDGLDTNAMFESFHSTVQEQVDKHCPEKVVKLSNKKSAKGALANEGCHQK